MCQDMGITRRGDVACAVAAVKPTAFAASRKLDPSSSLYSSKMVGSRKPVMP